MDTNKLNEPQKQLAEYINAHALQAAQWLAMQDKTPEAGYAEHKTSQALLTLAQGLVPAATVKTGLALTGFMLTMAGGSPNGPHLCIVAELDAIHCAAHPGASPTTGFAHACGHSFQQIAALLAFAALCQPNTLPQLTGKISFLAVPAEEYADFEAREALRQQGKIGYYSGKQELVRLGLTRELDMAIMVHSQPNSPAHSYYLGGSSLGFVAKTLTFTGKAAHASTPHQGVNALNAATLALQAMHTARETFQDEDHIRVHPILTKGGDQVNVVPGQAVVETFVRGASLPAIQKAEAAVDRAAAGAAIATGAGLCLQNLPGYLPLVQHPALTRLFGESITQLCPQSRLEYGADLAGSTDMGDWSHLMPCLHPTIGGFTGGLHTPQFAPLCTAPGLPDALLPTAAALALTTLRLLQNGAGAAREILDEYTPLLTQQEYLALLEKQFNTVTLDTTLHWKDA